MSYTGAAFRQDKRTGMETTADPLLAEHYRTWIGFTRLIRYVLAVIIIILIGMAVFLV